MELTDIRGIGIKTKNALNAKGIFSCKDLAKMMPNKYYNLTQPAKFIPNTKASTMYIELKTEPKTQYVKNLTITKAEALDIIGQSTINIIWYNQKYAKRAYHAGKRYIVYGNSRIQDFIVVAIFPEAKKDEILAIYPVYSKIGISRKLLQNAILECQKIEKIESIIPDNLLTKYNITSLSDAYKNIHKAKTQYELEQSLKRIELENAIEYLVKIGIYIKQNSVTRKEYTNLNYERYENELPYELTKSQRKVLEEIIEDYRIPKSQNRLIQGDVGSGKTMIALISALISIQNGYQVAFMVPTEILAQQHYNEYNKYFRNYAKSTIITSSDNKREDKEREVKSGETKLVFGTHILAQKLQFKNLGLVIIDEQQRFGVEIRGKLIEKSETRDNISISATPIPRSIKLSNLGILSTSRIEERPNKMQVETHFVSKNKESQMWEYLKSKSKIFVVCPRIEDEEDPFVDEERVSVEGITKKLKKIYGETNVLRIDGKTDSNKQRETVEKFYNGQEQILVATTVIEVGIDIPNAQAIVIIEPDKYGLSTLHQLRGRVGRNGEKGECYIIINKVLTKQAHDRLKYFKENIDGFKIAEYDYKTRGSGDINGTKQTGDNGIIYSKEVFEEAQVIVNEMNIKKVTIAEN